MCSRYLFPHFACGPVVKGFGRGSKELGIPTANFPAEVVNRLPSTLSTGIYYGVAKVNDGPVHRMVMSVGWNPYYKNTQKSMETHILHEFEEDFYGSWLRVAILGYIRPERNFASLGELILAIKADISFAEKKIIPLYLQRWSEHPFLCATLETLKQLENVENEYKTITQEELALLLPEIPLQNNECVNNVSNHENCENSLDSSPSKL